MKKILISLLFSLSMLPTVVMAHTATSVSLPESVDNGNNVTFTLTLSNTASWNIHLNGSGATSGCEKKFADVTADGKNTKKSFSVTCKATSIGEIIFTATGDATSEDGNNSDISITKKVQVVKPREKDSEARLSSLSINGYKINFNKDKYEYSISVEPTVTSIEISAKAISNYAKVTGIGKKEINPDGETVVVLVTSETGTKKEYKINVSVIDPDPIKITIDSSEYTIVKSQLTLNQPTDTIEGTVKIDKYDIPAFINENAGITIIRVKDDKDNICYATYEKSNDKTLSDTYTIYNENESEKLLLFIKEKEYTGYTKTKVIINEKEYDGYKIDNRFSIIYAMNLKTGEENFYKYDTEEKTLQVYVVNKEESKKTNNIIFYIIICLLSLVIIILLTLYIRKK